MSTDPGEPFWSVHKDPFCDSQSHEEKRKLLAALQRSLEIAWLGSEGAIPEHALVPTPLIKTYRVGNSTSMGCSYGEFDVMDPNLDIRLSEREDHIRECEHLELMEARHRYKRLLDEVGGKDIGRFKKQRTN